MDNSLKGKRIAIYARYSTDKQSVASVEDQVRICTRRIEALGGKVEANDIFADRGVSGSIKHREHSDRLYDHVVKGTYDAVVIEQMDRLTRSQEDSGWWMKRLKYNGVRLIAVHDGIDTTNESADLIAGIRSAVNENRLADLGRKTHRGMEGLALQVKVTGLLPFGYDSFDSPDGVGKVPRINEEQAAIVRRIFRERVEGKSFVKIATALSNEGIPTARASNGKRWNHTAVREMLKNNKYRGEWTWNEREFRKDPDTRKRCARLRSPDEIVSVHEEDLRIIDEDTWNIVSKMFEDRKRPGGRNAAYLLTGILKCARCGRNMFIGGGKKGARYYRCPSREKQKTCSNEKSFSENQLRQAVLDLVRCRFLSPEGQAQLRVIAKKQIAALSSRNGSSEALLSKRLKQAEKKIANITDMIAETGSRALLGKLNALETEQEQIRFEIAQASSAHPQVLSEVEVARLAGELDEQLTGDTDFVRQILKLLFPEGIEVEPEGDSAFTLRGIFSAEFVLQRPFNRRTRTRKDKNPTSESGGVSAKLVAGAGFEPTTFGL